MKDNRNVYKKMTAGKLGYRSSRWLAKKKSISLVNDKWYNYSVSLNESWKEKVSREKTTKFKVLINTTKKREREAIHVMKESAMIMEEGGAVLMNSINHSFESFDSCGRTFITILRLCVKTLSQSQYLFLRRFFFSFRSSVTWEHAHQGDARI